MLALILLAGCIKTEPQPDTVLAEDHEAYWLWAGVEPQPVLDQAKTIYLLAGEFPADGTPQLQAGRAVPQIDHADVWLVVRVETLIWSESHFTALNAVINRWERAGNRLVGIQVDFDANTRNLDLYADLLTDLRHKLPERYKLGITGLMDWSANGDPRHLAALSEVVDEAVFQVYQGRKTIPGYEKWLRNLDDLPMPFRIGLVQGGEWREPEMLLGIPNFQGYVIFLLNQDGNAPD